MERLDPGRQFIHQMTYAEEEWRALKKKVQRLRTKAEKKERKYGGD